MSETDIISAFSTALAAFATIRITYLTSKSVASTEKIASRNEIASSPVVVAEISTDQSGVRYISFKNHGLSPSINISFSGEVRGEKFPGTEYNEETCTISALHPTGGICQTKIVIRSQGATQFHEITNLKIKYYDLQGNEFISEYEKFSNNDNAFKWGRNKMG